MLRDYTRVDLTQDPEVRCVDGMRPIIYVEPATGVPSNRWLITLTGGPYCSAEDLDQNGSFESGQQCRDEYVDNAGDQMRTSAAPAMSNLNDAPGKPSGINSPDPLVNPVFAGYNRVRV